MSSTSSQREKKYQNSSTTNAQPYQKYVSKIAKNKKTDDGILNTIILGKLNKFSHANYKDIKEFLEQIMDSGETQFVCNFMALVFQKAASEELFCPLYAQLLSELSSKYTILLDEMSALYPKYIQIFEEVDETKVKDYEEFVKRNKEKKYRLGYSQFLAELAKQNIIETKYFIETISKIIDQIKGMSISENNVTAVEEYADCLMKIFKALNKNDGKGDVEFTKDLRTKIKDSVLNELKPFTIKNIDYKSISNKGRFTMLDICDEIHKL
jgi:coenzyme F420-reducing hydrogenase alpha subunit